MKLYFQNAYNETLKQKLGWTGSQADASAQRAGWVKGGYKRAEITTQEVDVPTDKQGLLSFLNKTQAVPV